jgi:transcriptional regulator with GAF, ATPase, and Fis domain
MDISRVEESLTKIGDAVLKEFPGADAVSVTLMDQETLETTYSTDPDATAVDQVQYANGTGPCVDAMRGNVVVRTEDLAIEDRWPQYARAAREKGFSAVLAAPLQLQSISIGALNIYSRSAGPFPEDLAPAAGAYATQASFAIDYAKLYAEAAVTVEQLEEALKSRAIIDQAIGILMEREKVGSREAFEMLRTASQHSNVKLREIAIRIVEGNGNGS